LKLLDDANAAIQYNREILQTALDHVRQGIAVFDKEMQLICWNRQFGDVLDLPPALTRAGVRLDDILRYNAARDTSAPDVIEKRVHTLMERYTEAGDAFIERFAERGLFIEVRANRMPDGGIATTFTDMTPSVEAAEALEKANETLERRVRERTEELTRLNAALARAKRDAEEANTSKTRFLAAASHDILQPLNAARLYVTSLVERSTGPNSQLVGNIDASLEAVEEIFNALLDISRLDAGVLRPEPTSFRIDQLLRQIEVEFAPIASGKGLELVFVPSQRVIRSDRRMLRRLLQNLVSNAIKYTPKGRVLVGCRLRGDQLRIDVFDTGVGIPESQHKTIFAEFHRLDQGARIARGLGLGLSIVERIARVLQHEIDMDSRVGHGTHFSITVPLSDAPPAHLPITLQPESDASQLAGTVAVCIDNEPAILDGMEALLGGWGCRVIKAADAATALQIIEQDKLRPNGLLVDYHLDRSNGIAAIARLRQQLGEDLPAILITADRSPRVRDEARTHGIQVLNKPLRPAALRALLAQWRVQRIAAAE
ncbi:MAG: hybrid sensor histidine kinase/response regulator, partial [Pseudolabrys sp.]